MSVIQRSIVAGLLLALPTTAFGKEGDLGRARSSLETMKQVVQQIEAFANQTKDDAIKQTCIVGSHREMVDIVAEVERAVESAAGKGSEAEAAALETVQVGAGTIDQLRADVYDCVGAEDLGAAGGPDGEGTYDPIRSSKEAATVGAPQVRPPAASPTK